jgi:hypothetical protein
VFIGEPGFWDSTLYGKVRAAWRPGNEKRVERKEPLLPEILLHECRHGYRTWLRSAGVSRAGGGGSRGSENAAGFALMVATMERRVGTGPGWRVQT